MAKLLVGPLLRYADEHEATVWVETDSACVVEVLGRRTPTFCVAGHHYGVLVLDGLRSGTEHEYTVTLDDEIVWPEEGDPPGLIRTPRIDGSLNIAFGSCRTAVPHEPPYTHTRDQSREGREVDSLRALGQRMRTTPTEEWPDALLMVGDQVYADEISPEVERMIKDRRSTLVGPKKQLADFEEYTWQYRRSWADPAVSWVLSSVPSAMIFDDHDVIDDWNTSGTWVRSQRRKKWWRERLIGAYMSYWIYQHLGNMSPAELRADPTLTALRENDGDGEAILREFAERAAEEVAGTRWSFRRDFGSTRLVVLDARAGRMVTDDSRREMLSEEQWEWVSEQLTGDVDHLLVASTLPIVMSPGIHHLESWNEAVCAGAWGRWAKRPAEWLRRLIDLEHWPAFRRSFERLLGELRSVAAGERGSPPASIVMLSGDVHHAYVAEVQYPAGSGVRSPVIQAVCSPTRNPLGTPERVFMKAALSRAGGSLARRLSRSAGVPDPPVRWRFVDDPTFDNQIGSVLIEDRTACVRIERTRPDDWRHPGLYLSLEHTVAG